MVKSDWRSAFASIDIDLDSMNFCYVNNQVAKIWYIIAEESDPDKLSVLNKRRDELDKRLRIVSKQLLVDLRKKDRANRKAKEAVIKKWQEEAKNATTDVLNEALVKIAANPTSINHMKRQLIEAELSLRLSSVT